MAVDAADPKNGFRHCEVVVFINQEVLRNGGSSAFYMTFQSRPWKEIEDGLKSIVVDSQVPLTTKRACAWSALALGVRVAMRQREKQSRLVQKLQEQVEEHEAATWTLAADLQRLRQERDEVISELCNARDNLKQVLHERDMLHKRLVEFELSQEILADSQDAGLRVRKNLAAQGRSEAYHKRLRSRPDAVSRKKTQMTSGTALETLHEAEEDPGSSM